MGPTWVLSAPDGPMILAISGVYGCCPSNHVICCVYVCLPAKIILSQLYFLPGANLIRQQNYPAWPSNMRESQFVFALPVDGPPCWTYFFDVGWLSRTWIAFSKLFVFGRNYHGWPSTQPGTCTQPCPIVHTAVPPLFTQPCPGRTMSTAVCIYVAGLCASCPAV